MTTIWDVTLEDTPVPHRPRASIARQSDGALGTVHTLHPGDVAMADRGERLETLLGSCVAIVLTDPRRTVGAMCHIVHTPSSVITHNAGAYADVALESMHTLLRRRAINPRLCEAWVYGGGNMFPTLDIAPGAAVGDDNARWVLDALEAEGIRLLHHDIGGTVYRRLSWTVGLGSPEVVAVHV